MRQKPCGTFFPVVQHERPRRQGCALHDGEGFRRLRNIGVPKVNDTWRSPLDKGDRSPQGFRGSCSIASQKWRKAQLNETLSRYLFRHLSQLDVFIVPGNAASPAVAPLAVVGLHPLVGAFALFQQELLRDANVDELPRKHFVQRNITIVEVWIDTRFFEGSHPQVEVEHLIPAVKPAAKLVCLEYGAPDSSVAAR